MIRDEVARRKSINDIPARKGPMSGLTRLYLQAKKKVNDERNKAEDNVSDIRLSNDHLDLLATITKTPGVTERKLTDVTHDINKFRTIGLRVSRQDIMTQIFEINCYFSDIIKILPAERDMLLRIKTSRKEICQMVLKERNKLST